MRSHRHIGDHRLQFLDHFFQYGINAIFVFHWQVHRHGEVAVADFSADFGNHQRIATDLFKNAEGNQKSDKNAASNRCARTYGHKQLRPVDLGLHMLMLGLAGLS